MMEPYRGDNGARQRLHELLEVASAEDRMSRFVDWLIIVLILANVAAFVLSTVPAIDARFHGEFEAFERISIALFTLEYVARIWACVEHPPLRHLSAWRARLRFAMHPFLLIDLLAILPYYLSAIFGLDLRVLRVLRLFRFFKIVRYSPALQVMLRVVINEARALLGSFLIMIALLLLAATGMYIIERDVQPDVFGSVPAAMWWAMATLTTVGFGDVTPITALGKVWSGIFMVFGLGMFALPIGIISTGFAQELSRRDFVITWNMVAKIPIFAPLSAAEAAHVMRHLHSERVMQGHYVYHAGDPPDAMYFIESGTVQLTTATGIVANLESGDHFGETGLLSGRPHTATVQAESDCHLLKLQLQDFERLVARFGHFRSALESSVARRAKDEKP